MGASVTKLEKQDAAVEPLDDDEEDEDASCSLEACWALSESSRQRQGKPPQLTSDEQRLTLEECEFLLRREHEAEKIAREQAAVEQYIKRLRRLLPFELGVIVLGVGLWFLAYMDWLPATRDTKIFYLGFAGLALGSASISYLDLRAHRLGTQRARNQARAAKMAARGLFIAFGVAVTGAILLALGFVVYESWLSGGLEENAFLVIIFLALILIQLLVFPALSWIEARENITRPVFGSIAFGLLLTAYLASLLYWYWMWPRIPDDRLEPHPTILLILLLLMSWPLWLGCIDSAWK